jgi:predicted transcriptional regulator
MSQDYFAKANQTLLRDGGKLSPNAKILYLNLMLYQGQNEKAFPSVKTLANDLGVSEKTIHRLKNELIEANLIEIEKHQNKVGWANNEYLVRDIYVCHESVKDTDDTQCVSNMSYNEGHRVHTNNIQYNDIQYNKNQDYNISGSGVTQSVTPSPDYSIKSSKTRSSDSKGTAFIESIDNRIYFTPSDNLVHSFIDIYTAARQLYQLAPIKITDKHIENIKSTPEHLVEKANDIIFLQQWFKYCDTDDGTLEHHYEMRSDKSPSVLFNESVFNRFINHLKTPICT